jgi:hypothetical protein
MFKEDNVSSFNGLGHLASNQIIRVRPSKRQQKDW